MKPDKRNSSEKKNTKNTEKSKKNEKMKKQKLKSLIHNTKLSKSLINKLQKEQAPNYIINKLKAKLNLKKSHALLFKEFKKENKQRKMGQIQTETCLCCYKDYRKESLKNHFCYWCSVSKVVKRQEFCPCCETLNNYYVVKQIIDNRTCYDYYTNDSCVHFQTLFLDAIWINPSVEYKPVWSEYKNPLSINTILNQDVIDEHISFTQLINDAEDLLKEFNTQEFSSQ